MTQLNPHIGDRRLGDIIIPGSHDAGTYGIDENSYLIDRNFLFQLGEIVTPQTLVNWSLTVDIDFTEQLNLGCREFDLRIADATSFDGTFRWWHGLTGDEIHLGLQQFYNFAVANPMEVIIMHFNHFAAPGESGTIPITPAKKDEIADILLEYLGPIAVPESLVSVNPTVNEILGTGKNVIILMGDQYIRDKDDIFWPRNLHNPWSGRTNPEALFENRAAELANNKINHPDRMTRVSGCLTPDEVVVAGALIRVYGDNPIIKEILERLLPGVAALEADLMSFEGVYTSLLEQARYGTNSGGMLVRPKDLYTNGESINYYGMNNQWEMLFSKPHIYKPNIIYVDDFGSTTLVDWAIRANMGMLMRQARVVFQGSCRDGFYEWVDFQAIGGDEICGGIDTRYIVKSATGEVLRQGEKSTESEEKWSVTFEEGDYPTDAEVGVQVSLPVIGWFEVSSTNIQSLIESGNDLFIRGNEGNGGGFIYTSYEYDLFGEDCSTRPDNDANFIDMFVW